MTVSALRTAPALALLTVVLLAASGCTAEPSAAPTSAATNTPTATTEPTTEPTPSADPTADPADPSTWIISEDGVGPIGIGADFDEALAVLPDTWTTDAANCGWVAWLNNGIRSQYFVRPSDGSSNEVLLVSIADWDENPSADGMPTTTDGLSIGSTRDEVLAAYPEAVESTSTIGEYALLALPSSGEATVFFQFRADTEQASAVTVTTDDEPPYEVCA